MNDFLDDRRREISERLKELKPFVDEFNRLEEAASALAGVVGSAASGASAAITRRRGPGRPRGTGGAKSEHPHDRQRHRHPRHENPQESQKSSRQTESDSTARKPGRPAKRRAGRRKGSGTRAAEALSFVQGQPGITIPELAAKMGIKQNYLYRVLPGLESGKKGGEERPRLVPAGLTHPSTAVHRRRRTHTRLSSKGAPPSRRAPFF